MIIVHTPSPAGGLDRRVIEAGEAIPDKAIWIDLLEPTRGEDELVERWLSISVPTREEMQDIEPSEIIYAENDARYMTARVLCQSETDEPRLTAISFILTQRALVTVRYDEPRAFAMFIQRACKPAGSGPQPEAVFDGLLEAIIDRAADILGRLGGEIEALSRTVFEREGKKLESTGYGRSSASSAGRPT